MRTRIMFLTAALASASVAAGPAAAVTFVFAKATGGTTNSQTLGITSEGETVVASGATYSIDPATLNHVSQFTGTAQVSRTSSLTTGGIGVNSENLNNNDPDEPGPNPLLVDTTGSVNEALRFRAESGNLMRLTSLTLSSIDPNDTLQIFGLGDDGALTVFDIGGLVAGTGDNAFTGGVATRLSGSVTNQQWRIDFTGQEAFRELFFTVRNDTADGYRLNAFDVEFVPPVPEPAAWALMIGGLGMVGASLRRARFGKVVTA